MQGGKSGHEWAPEGGPPPPGTPQPETEAQVSVAVGARAGPGPYPGAAEPAAEAPRPLSHFFAVLRFRFQCVPSAGTEQVCFCLSFF